MPDNTGISCLSAVGTIKFQKNQALLTEKKSVFKADCINLYITKNHMENSKKYLVNRTKILFSFIILMILPVLLFAQDPGDPTGDPDIPIDGGVGILVAAGIGYGYKKYRESRNKANQADF